MELIIILIGIVVIAISQGKKEDEKAANSSTRAEGAVHAAASIGWTLVLGFAGFSVLAMLCLSGAFLPSS